MNSLSLQTADFYIQKALIENFKYLKTKKQPKIYFTDNMPPNAYEFFIDNVNGYIVLDGQLMRSIVLNKDEKKLFNLLCTASRAFWQLFGENQGEIHEDVLNENYDGLYADMIAWTLYMNYKKYNEMPEVTVESHEDKSKSVFMEKRINELFKTFIENEGKE